MVNLNKIIGFEWDRWNSDKSYKKHGITQNEAEQVFLDPKQLILDDVKHSQDERRFTIIAQINNKAILFITFTVRKDKIRIISARKANTKERRLYEKKT